MRLFVRCFILFLVLLIVSFSTYSYSIAVAQDTEAEEDKSPKMNSPVISPDGTHIAFLHWSEGEELLVSWDLVSNEQKVIAAPTGSDFYWFEWANNDRLLVALSLSRDAVTPTMRGIMDYTIERTKEAIEDEYDKETVELSPIHGTRLWGYNNNLEFVLDIFKLGPTAIPSGVTRKQMSDYILYQANVIDILPDDPNHILMSVGLQGYRDDEIRMVNVNDASFEVIKRYDSWTHWTTDQNNVIRFGRNLYYSNTAQHHIANSKSKSIYLNPITNEWEQITSSELPIQHVLNVSFMKDNRYAFIKYRYGSLVLYDFLEKKAVQTIADEKSTMLHMPGGFNRYGKLVGYLNDGDIHYIDENYMTLHETLNQVFPNNFNRISSAATTVGKFIVFSMAEGQSGAYYLLDMQKGSLDKLMDRY